MTKYLVLRTVLDGIRNVYITWNNLTNSIFCTPLVYNLHAHGLVVFDIESITVDELGDEFGVRSRDVVPITTLVSMVTLDKRTLLVSDLGWADLAMS